MFCWENSSQLNKVNFCPKIRHKNVSERVSELLDFKIFSRACPQNHSASSFLILGMAWLRPCLYAIEKNTAV